MKNIALGALVVVALVATVQAQVKPPKLLIHAIQCVAAKKFLSSSKVPKLTFGYLLDEGSYPGRKVVYVVEYTTPSRSNGQVYAVFVTEHRGRQVFNVQNNAKFVLSKDEPNGVSFVTPPLGGIWTHEHLSLAIREIEKQPRFVISARDLSSISESITCEAYTDSE